MPIRYVSQAVGDACPVVAMIITIPAADLIAGDLMIVLVRGNSINPPPAGWTSRGSFAPYADFLLCDRFFVPGDVSVTFTTPGASGITGFMYCVRGARILGGPFLSLVMRDVIVPGTTTIDPFPTAGGDFPDALVLLGWQRAVPGTASFTWASVPLLNRQIIDQSACGGYSLGLMLFTPAVGPPVGSLNDITRAILFDPEVSDVGPAATQNWAFTITYLSEPAGAGGGGFHKRRSGGRIGPG